MHRMGCIIEHVLNRVCENNADKADRISSNVATHGQSGQSLNKYVIWVLLWVQGYIVLNRPWAFVQWLRKAHIEEEYV